MISDIIISNLIPSNQYIYGIADLEGILNDKFNEFNYGISIGKRLYNEIIDNIENGPTIEYYHHYQEINRHLIKIAENIKKDLKKANIDSIIIEPTISTDSVEFEQYLQTLTCDVSHKMVATRAGLGWIGKTDLFIAKDFGPRLRLVTILINRKPEIESTPIEISKCGNCDICVERCPANAANGKPWDVSVHRDEFFDAFKCREKCTELSKQQLNLDRRICGICVSVCPIGKKNISATSTDNESQN